MRLGVYLLDQSWARTQSKGIYAYSRTLVAALVERLAGHEIALFVNDANRDHMAPSSVPPHVRVVTLPARCAVGTSRLLADHLLAPWLARRFGLDLLHFPKGFIPWFGCGATRITATVHDTIPAYYQRHYPGYFSSLKLRYLAAALRTTLRRATLIMTDSQFSRDALLAVTRQWRLSPPPIVVCPLTPDPALTAESGPPISRRAPTLLHLGSPLPHKRTRQTVEAFRRFNASRAAVWRLRVAGLASCPPAWGLEPGTDLDFLGPLSPEALARELREAKALLLLSSIEGFGLPALEAWFVGTPVCYASTGALPELLGGVPGGCRPDLTDFAEALDQLLALSDTDVAHHGDALRTRFSPETFARCIVGALSAVLSGPSSETGERPSQPP